MHVSISSFTAKIWSASVNRALLPSLAGRRVFGMRALFTPFAREGKKFCVATSNRRWLVVAPSWEKLKYD